MSFKGEFAEILKEKLGMEVHSQQKVAPITPSYSTVSAPFVGGFSLPNFKFQGSLNKFYPASPRQTQVKKVKSQPIKKASKFDSLSVLKLSEKAQKAFFLMIKLGAQFEDGKINTEILKSEFRRLAKTYHPDNQGPRASAKKFHYLHTCKRILGTELELFKH